MIGPIMRGPFGLVATLLLTVAMQDYEIPNDRGGVGANGAIGRGTSTGERFVRARVPQPATPAWVYTAPVYTQPEPAPVAARAPESLGPVERPPVEQAVYLWALVRRNPYQVYHRGWVHGYWTARVTDFRSRLAAPPFGTEVTAREGPLAGMGMGLGWGLPGWLIGPMAYNWGYYPYKNPYLAGGPPVADRARFDDYSRPIDVRNAPPTDALLDDALVAFRAARDAFRRDDYARARERTEAALRLMPDDPMLHQFRALNSFALGRYQEAAAALHAVLAVGPGWDWKTMVSLYGDRETYARHLRRLEGNSQEHPGSAEARFVLGYHYLITGYADEAVDQWRRVLGLRPDDRITEGLIQELRPSHANSPDRDAARALAPGATGSVADDRPGKPGELVGTWIAHPDTDTTITMVFQPRGRILWKVAEPGRDRESRGYAIYEKNILTLSQDQDNTLVGTVRWQDPGHFTFTALPARRGDPGLLFARSGAPSERIASEGAR